MLIGPLDGGDDIYISDTTTPRDIRRKHTSSMCSIVTVCCFSTSTLSVVRQERHLLCKKAAPELLKCSQEGDLLGDMT